jgi:hypothetical protein
MPGCCFWHERILRHQPALCRSAAALISARSYSAARHGRSGQSREGPRCESLHCSSSCSRSQEWSLPANHLLRVRFEVPSSVVLLVVAAALP